MAIERQYWYARKKFSDGAYGFWPANKKKQKQYQENVVETKKKKPSELERNRPERAGDAPRRTRNGYITRDTDWEQKQMPTTRKQLTNQHEVARRSVAYKASLDLI